MSVVVLLLVGWAAMVAMMTALWWVERTKRDAGVVDVGWTAGLGILAVSYALVSHGDPGQRMLVALLASLWSARLALYVYLDRVHGKQEDGRYQELRARWGEHAQVRYFAFFQLQGLIVVVMSLPFLVIARHSAPLSAWSATAVALWLLAVGGESLADRQLAAFRADPARRGSVCRHGLWRYSRHPNYFCEWLHWWTYVLAGVGAPWWGLTLVSPALISYFLFRVTGIPTTEREALRRRGEAYRAYQRTTSAFIPWFPRRGRLAASEHDPSPGA